MDANKPTTGFRVMAKACPTCIYRKDSPLNLEALENEVRDPHVGFWGSRICHYTEDVCCRGFWNAHKDEFPAGQIAQRLGFVVFVEEPHNGGTAQNFRPFPWR